MLKTSVSAVMLLAGAALASVPAVAAPALPQRAAAVSNIVPVQGRGARCHRLRERIREIEARLDYAPRWERRHLERRLWRARREFRESCRRWH